MKKIFLTIIAFLMMSSLAFGATLNLKATWDVNLELDMASYKLYRTDGTRTLLSTIPHPTTTYKFSVDVLDDSEGTLVFVLTAIDTSDNESLDSSSASFSYDYRCPARPTGLTVSK